MISIKLLNNRVILSKTYIDGDENLGYTILDIDYDPTMMLYDPQTKNLSIDEHYTRYTVLQDKQKNNLTKQRMLDIILLNAPIEQQVLESTEYKSWFENTMDYISSIDDADITEDIINNIKPYNIQGINKSE